VYVRMGNFMNASDRDDGWRTDEVDRLLKRFAPRNSTELEFGQS
jgi:hypothetical protein